MSFYIEYLCTNNVFVKFLKEMKNHCFKIVFVPALPVSSVIT